MSKLDGLKEGDRVTFVVTGTVGHFSTGGHFGDFLNFADNGLYVTSLVADDIVSWEKIPEPLPTTPGSVIKIEGGFACLDADGRWFDVDGAIKPSVGAEVQYDAGADAPSLIDQT